MPQSDLIEYLNYRTATESPSASAIPSSTITLQQQEQQEQQPSTSTDSSFEPTTLPCEPSSSPPPSAKASPPSTANPANIFTSKIQPRLKDIARWSLLCASEMVEHRKNSFELFGFDYMIDNDYNAWLIEINSSPACDYSTKVSSYVTM